MSSASKKNEERSLKAIRELITIQHNKQCIECGQKGPTYVDMTTTSFICTRCSGFLRGINPPHRVKSISMTTFTDEELEKLRKGGNEIARLVWLGRWDQTKDKEVNTKDEQVFREFLRDKYERKRWYKDPAEVHKSRSPEPTAAKTTTLSTPPSKTSIKQQPIVITSKPSSTAPGQSTMSATPTKPQPSQQQPQPDNQQPNLLDGFDSDPFAPKAPTGGVSVLPQVPPTTSKPLLSTTGSTGDFGAFTSAPVQPLTSQPLGPSGGSGLLQPLNTSGGSSQPTATPSQMPPMGGGSMGDRYAALASLDTTLKEIRIKEEEKEKQVLMQKQQEDFQKQQQLQMQQMREQQLKQQQMGMTAQQHAMMGMGGVNMGGVNMGGANPFGGTPPLQKKESNPFLTGGGHTPPVTGPPRPQGGFGQAGVGTGFMTGQAGFGQQPPTATAFGNFPGQQPAAGQGGFGTAFQQQPPTQTGFGAGGFGGFGQPGQPGGYVMQQPPAATGQQGGGFAAFGQPTQPGQGAGSGFGMFGQQAPPTQGGGGFASFGQQPPAAGQGTGFGANFGQPNQQPNQGFYKQGFQQATPANFSGQQPPQAVFGAQNPGLSPVLSPGMNFGTSPVVQNKQQNFGGAFSQPQSQTNTGSQWQSQPKTQQSWGTGTGTSANTSGTGMGLNSGWSTDLSNPASALQQQPSAGNTGWSNSLNTTGGGAGNMSGWGSSLQQPSSGGGWGMNQQQNMTAAGGSGLQPTSFMGSSSTKQSSGSNPFM